MEDYELNLFGIEDLRLGYGIFPVTLADGSVEDFSEIDISFFLPEYSINGLPSDARDGSIVRASDGSRGLWQYLNGLWVPLNGLVCHAWAFGFHPSCTAAQNTAAWENLIDAIPSTGGTILIPSGEYEHEGLVIDQHHVTVRGDINPNLSGKVRLVCTLDDVDSLIITNVNQVSICGVWVGHSVNTEEGIAAIRASGYGRLILRDVSTAVPDGLPVSYAGVVLESVGSESFISFIEDCDITGHPGYGILLQGSAANRRVGETLVSNSTILDNELAGIAIKDYVYGVYIRSGVTLGFRNGHDIHIDVSADDNRTRDIFIGPGVILDAADGSSIEGSNATSVHIIGNWISSAGFALSDDDAWGIDLLTDSIGWVIKDNIITHNRGGGVRFAGTHSHIENNYFLQNGGLAAPSVGLHLLNGSQGVAYGSNKFLLHDVAYDDDSGNLNCPGVNYVDTEVRPRLSAGFAVDDGFFISLTNNTPVFGLAANDFMQYNRTTNQFEIFVNNTQQFGVSPGAAGETSLLLYDVSASSFKRVKVDSADSGTGTKKYLYVDERLRNKKKEWTVSDPCPFAASAYLLSGIDLSTDKASVKTGSARAGIIRQRNPKCHGPR